MKYNFSPDFDSRACHMIHVGSKHHAHIPSRRISLALFVHRLGDKTVGMNKKAFVAVDGVSWDSSDSTSSGLKV